MAQKTKIQWCDSTINPVMGCGGCELYISPGEILAHLDLEMAGHGAWPQGTSRDIYRQLITETYERIANLMPGHSKSLTTTNIYHLRKEFLAEVASGLGKKASIAAERVIGESIACYAAKNHLSKARSIVNPGRGFNTGYAPAFEMVTRFEDRVCKAALYRDLRGQSRADKPWLDDLPRHIFVSDMGDAFSRESDFEFLEKEVIEPIRSVSGQRHRWLWLTKRPDRMERFGERINGFPPNVIAMTTLTGPGTLNRVDQLRRVSAAKRGLSIEPLRQRICASELDLSGIDWVIVGGESGRREHVCPFDLDWARELRDHCQVSGAAFFLKQLGRRPVETGKEFRFHDSHGGEWDEWPEDLRFREMPLIST